MDLEYAKELLEKTKKDFDIIAEDFSKTRKTIWPELKDLEKYIKKNKRVLDLGCGNGRLFELFKNKEVEYIGIDFSKNLIAEAKKKYGNHFQVADILSLPRTQKTSKIARDNKNGFECRGLPFSDNYFDSIWAIAVFHHIPSKELRLKVLKEIKRILKKEGRIIVVCWNLYQMRYLKLLLKFTLKKIFLKSKLDFKDTLVSWGRERVSRYYRAFTLSELRKLFKEVGFEIEELKYLKRNNKKTNILIIAKK